MSADLRKDLELLIHSRYPIIAVETHEEERLETVLRDLAAELGVPLFVWTVTAGLQRLGFEHEIDDSRAPAKALANIAARAAQGIYLFKDLHRHLEQPEVVRKLRDLTRVFSQDHRALVVCAPEVKLPPELVKHTASVTMALPGAEELRTLARTVVRDLSARHRIRVELSSEEFEHLVERLKGLTLFEAERALARAILDDLALTRKDLDVLVELKKAALESGGVVEYSVPEEGMADVGGLARLKAWLEKRRRAYSAEAKRFGLEPPKGILLLGVQGCGKSLAAKAVARSWGLPLLRLEPARLYEKYVGESEKNLERTLAVAERMAPCVLMIDEIEKGLAYTGSGDADAGLSRRIFGRLLSWLQDRQAPVFVVATCNQIAQMPPELMRKGRFDEIFFIDLPDPGERKEIFTVHLKKRGRDPARFDLDALAAASEGFSGAEVEQAVVAALYTAFSARRELDTAHLVEELQATRPLSVIRREEVAGLREWARHRTVPAR